MLLDVGSTTARVRDERRLDDDAAIGQVLVGDDRVFLYTYAIYTGSSPGVIVASGLAEGSIELASKEISPANVGWPRAVDGTRLLFASDYPPTLSVFDAADLDDLTFEMKGELSGNLSTVTVSGDSALCSLGNYGLDVVDLGD
jgi:hypothetical protein